MTKNNMKTWAVIYEYCSDPSCAEASAGGHPNCVNGDHQRTVLIQACPEVPEINLLVSKLIQEIHPKTVPVISDAQEFVNRKSLTVNRAMDSINRKSLTVNRTIGVANTPRRTLTFRMPVPMAQFVGLMLLAFGLGGILAPYTQNIRLEAAYIGGEIARTYKEIVTPAKELPKSVPVVFEPLTTPDGASIDPVNKDFSLIIPKIGVNANVVANVDPTNYVKYDDALEHGVAHASTSFFPDENGTVYLFSHSTNYDWFVKDLNAVFYLVKNLDTGDSIVLFYKGNEYTYKVTSKKIVSPSDTSYLVPVMGKRSLILQTCWPPGSTTERLLIFANLITNNGKQI